MTANELHRLAAGIALSSYIPIDKRRSVAEDIANALMFVGDRKRRFLHRVDELIQWSGKKPRWVHTNQIVPSTIEPHDAKPYTKVGDTKRCVICGDVIREVME